MKQSEHKLHRRDFMRLGSLGAVGLGLEAAPRAARSCILIWQSGGCSQLDTFDMKPEAPREIRGEFKSIATNVPGIRICEHLPLTARHADKFAILRSMRSGETNHERAVHYLETGFRLSPGAVPPGIRSVLGGPPAPALSVESGTARERERYGGTPLGRGCLAARRLVQAGARFVMVGNGRPGYDTHADNFRRLKHALLPEFDRAFSALLSDLGERGLLPTTLVIVMGEFGRAPRINAQAGRDHHADAWSVLLAGAGVPGGALIGATDKTGAEVIDRPVEPPDLLRTVYAILRAEPAREGLAAGRVIRELVA